MSGADCLKCLGVVAAALIGWRAVPYVLSILILIGWRLFGGSDGDD